MRFPADEADLAIIAGPAVPLEVGDEVGGVDPARRVDGGAAAVARDQGLLVARRVARLGAKALAADGARGGPLEKDMERTCENLFGCRGLKAISVMAIPRLAIWGKLDK